VSGNLNEFEIIEFSKLSKMYKILNYQVISSGALPIVYFLPINFVYLLTLAAILFTPYMLYVLYEEKKIGWIVSFVVIVLIPSVLIVFFYSDLFLLLLLPFYLYCFLLRFEVKNWLSEKRARNDLLLQRYRKANQSESIDDWIVMR